MPQLAYGLAPAPAHAGMLYDNERSNARIVNVIAGAIIPPGVLCELVTVSGKPLLFPLKDSTTGGSFLPKIVGVSLFDSIGAEQAYVPYAVPPSGAGSTFAGYPIGFVVPVVRKGLIWTAWDGNTGTALPVGMGPLQVWHSSDGTHSQGIVTTLAVSATAGAEIDNLPATAQLYDPRGFGGTYLGNLSNTTESIVPLEVNFPGHI